MKIMIPINIRLPADIIQEVDDLARNRSAFIRTAIRKHLSDDAPTIADAPTRQLMAALSSRKDCDETLATLLVAMLNRELGN